MKNGLKKTILTFIVAANFALIGSVAKAESCSAQNEYGETCSVQCTEKLATAFCENGTSSDQPICKCEQPPKAIHQAAVKGMPVFSYGPLNADTKATFFLSPTCNHCNRLYLDAMGAIRDQKSDIAQSTEFTFFLYPRKIEDIAIIATLLCVPEKKFVAAVDAYQRALWNEYYGRAISYSFAKDASKKVARDYGRSDADVKKCVASEKTRSSIRSVYEAGRQFPHDNVPIIVVDKKAQSIHQYSRAWSEIRPLFTK